MAGMLGVASWRGKRRREHVNFSLSEVSFVGGSIVCADAAAEPADLTSDRQLAGANLTRSPCLASPARIAQAVQTTIDHDDGPTSQSRFPTLSDVLWKHDLTWDEVWLTYQRADCSPPPSPLPTKAHVSCTSAHFPRESLSVRVFGGRDSCLHGEVRECAVGEGEGRSRARGGCAAAERGERVDGLVDKGGSSRRGCPLLGATRVQVETQKQVRQESPARAVAVEGSERRRDANPKTPYSGLFEQPLRVPAANASRRVWSTLNVKLDSASQLFSNNLSLWGVEEGVRDDDGLQRQALPREAWHGRRSEDEGVPSGSSAPECWGVLGECDMSSRESLSSYLTCPTLSFEAALHDTSGDEGVGERAYVDASGSDSEHYRAEDFEGGDSQAASCACVWDHYSNSDSCPASMRALGSLAQEHGLKHCGQTAGGARRAVQNIDPDVGSCGGVGADSCGEWRMSIARGSEEAAALAVVTRVLERLRQVCGMMDENILSEWELAQGLLRRDGGQSGFVESARNPVIRRVRDALSGGAGRGWDVDAAYRRVCGRGDVNK